MHGWLAVKPLQEGCSSLDSHMVEELSKLHWNEMCQTESRKRRDVGVYNDEMDILSTILIE